MPLLALVLWLAAAVLASTFSQDAQASPSHGSRPTSLGLLGDEMDTLGRPYAVVDKGRAVISVHHADGRLAGSSAVLLGTALGDDSLPGVGERTEAGRLRTQDKTTPAGRFVAETGRNLKGDTVVWLDYDAALAIHRLRPGRAAAVRAKALAQGDARARRLSDGCVVVPSDFFDHVVLPLLGTANGVVIVLPEAETRAQHGQGRTVH